MKTFNTLLVATLLFASPLFSQQEHSSKDIIVQFQPDVEAADFVEKMAAQLSPALDLKLKKPLAPKFGIYLLTCQNESETVALPAFLERQPQVQSARFDQPVTFRDSIPNDSLFHEQWDMRLIEAPAVWQFATGGKTALGDEIVIAVLDKSFDLNHEDFQGNVWQNPGEISDGNDNDGNGYPDDLHGWNFRFHSPDFQDFLLEPHGTWVSGVLGAKGNNGKGLAGVNWNVKLMFLAVSKVSETVAALQYVLEMREKYNATGGAEGAFVVVTNSSFGIDTAFCEEQPAWGVMLDKVGEAGVLNVAATANEDWDVDKLGDLPTSCPSEYLLSVTNTDSTDHLAEDAAFGIESIDLAAPGRFTTTTNTLDRYKDNFSGTSSACPHVAGAVALMYSLPCTELAEAARNQPANTALLVRDAIFEGVDVLPDLSGKVKTGGRLNLLKSMSYVHSYCVARPEERSSGEFFDTYFNNNDLVRLFPNPVHDQLTIEFQTRRFADFDIEVFNVFGQKITDVTASPEPFQKQFAYLDMSDYANGTYFISVRTGLKKISTLRIVKL